MGVIQEMMVCFLAKALYYQLSLTFHIIYFQGTLEIEKHSCAWTGYKNNWDGGLTYTVAPDWMVNGFASVHDNGKEDRRFKYQICKTRIRGMFLIS